MTKPIQQPARSLALRRGPAAGLQWPDIAPPPAGRRRRLAAISATLLAFVASSPLFAHEMSTLIVKATVIDGSGAAATQRDVRISGDHIVEIGKLTPRMDEQVIDGTGQVLAPGFIDTHSHHDMGLNEDPRAEVLISQGVTTAIFGQDGDESTSDGRPASLADILADRRKHSSSINYAYYAGHNGIRARAMGDDWNREATPREIDTMRSMLADDMRAGALGLSTGLEYDPGRASSHGEILALAKEAAGFGGRYISHMRNEDDHLFAAIDELLTIGREAKMPVQISHMKLGGVSVWGKSAEVLAKLDKARADGIAVSVDIYPYDRWHTGIVSLFPDRNYKDPAVMRHVLSNLVPPDGILIDGYRPDPSVEGKTLAEIAAQRGEDPAAVLTAMLDASGGKESDLLVMGRSMREADVAALIAWPQANICSDGALNDRHPRVTGSFARILAHHVRETGNLSLADAVRKMSGLAADHMGFTDRGYIRPGYKADLLLFDPASIRDRATFATPGALATGVSRVWVNGTLVWDGKATGALPGQYIPRSSAEAAAKR